MVSEIWANVCQRVAPSPSENGRYMAYGRGVSENQRQNPLFVASCGSVRQRARYPGAEPTQQACCQKILPQAPQRTAICATSDHYGQTEELCCRQTRDIARCRTSAAQSIE